MPRVTLPSWIVEDAVSIRREVAPYVNASAAELWKLTEACARDAMWAIEACDVPERAMAHRDPLPESTIKALKRLRVR